VSEGCVALSLFIPIDRSIDLSWLGAFSLLLLLLHFKSINLSFSVRKKKIRREWMDGKEENQGGKLIVLNWGLKDSFPVCASARHPGRKWFNHIVRPSFF